MFFFEKYEKLHLNYPQYPLLSGALGPSKQGTNLQWKEFLPLEADSFL